MASDDMNEVVTRGILKEELQQELQQELQKFGQELRQELRQEFRQEFATKVDLEIWAGALRGVIAEDIKNAFAEFNVIVRQDMQAAVGMALADFERQQALALEPTKDIPERVAAIEQADLPARVRRLEAKVFPPKRPARRRRG